MAILEKRIAMDRYVCFRFIERAQNDYYESIWPTWKHYSVYSSIEFCEAFIDKLMSQFINANANL